MKNTIILFFFFTCISYAQQTSIKITKIKSDLECKMCYGKLIITNGIKTDTISGGKWGEALNYSIKKINKKEYLFLDNDYNHSGGNYVKQIGLFSLGNKSFLREIFSKKIVLRKESFEDLNNNPTNYIYENAPEIEFSDTLVITNNIVIKKCPEKLGEKCFEVLTSSDTEINYFH